MNPLAACTSTEEDQMAMPMDGDDQGDGDQGKLNVSPDAPQELDDLATAEGGLPAEPTNATMPDGPADIETVFGGFNVALTQPAPDPANPDPTPFTSVFGKFADGPYPPGLLLKLQQEEAGCQLLAVTSSFCDPACVQGECNLNNECVPYPQPRHVGDVRVEGLGDPLVLSPAGGSAVYMPRMSPPFPPCDEGDPVRFEADALTLQGTCISPLELTLGDEPVPFMTGESVELAWTPPKIADESHIEIEVDLSHHGGTKGEIHCDIPDTGSFQIPQDLVDGLIDLGLSGFPTLSISRVARSELPGRPEVTLTILSTVVRQLDTGLDSCATDENCPDGLTCEADFACR